MDEACADQVELNSLVMLADKRRHLKRPHVLLEAFTANQLSAAGNNGTMPASAATDADGIINRSPTTNYHYYNASTPTDTAPAPVQPTPAQPVPTTPTAPTAPPTSNSGMPSWVPWVAGPLIGAAIAGAPLAWGWFNRPAAPAPSKVPTYDPNTTIKFS